MLVMDEFMAADRYGLIPHEEAIQFLKEKPEGLEVVLTGRDPSEDPIRIADYVSEIRKAKSIRLIAAFMPAEELNIKYYFVCMDAALCDRRSRCFT